MFTSAVTKCNLSPVPMLLMAWPFSHNKTVCASHSSRQREERDRGAIYRAKQHDHTLRQCLSACLFVFQSVCAFEATTADTPALFPTCLHFCSLACFTRLRISFFSSISFYQLILFHPPSLPSQAESTA